MIIAIDFDGTCVTHEFPAIGKEIGAAEVLKKLTDKGHQLVLFTMRSDFPATDHNDDPANYLADAVKWFESHNIPLYGINTNPNQKYWTKSPKAYAQLYIDDAALGCPVTYDKKISKRPYVDWGKVEKMLVRLKLI